MNSSWRAEPQRLARTVSISSPCRSERISEVLLRPSAGGQAPDPARRRLLDGGEDPDSVPCLEHELGLGLTNDAVHGYVLQYQVSECLCALDGNMQVEVVLAGDVQDL